MPPSPPLPPETLARFFVRRLDGRITGPHEKGSIVEMLGSGELQGGEEIAIDRRTWKPLSLLVAPPPSPGGKPPPAPAAAGRADFIDLPALDAPIGLGTEAMGAGLDLDAPAPERAGGRAPLGSLDPEPTGTISLGAPTAPRASLDPKVGAARGRAEGGLPPLESKGLAALTNMFEQRRTATRGIPIVTDVPAAGLDAAETTRTDEGPPAAEGGGLSLSLELVERKPTKPAPEPSGRAAGDAAKRDSAAPAREGAAARPGAMSLSLRIPLPPAAEIEAAGAARGGAREPAVPAAESSAPAAPAKAKPRERGRTATAARPGAPTDATAGRRPSRRVLIGAGSVVALAIAGAVAVVFELPARLRPEPALAEVLGASATGIAEDRFAAFSEGARLLEDAVAARKRAPVTRAEAAMLLAASVVIHGGERGRLAHAEELLPAPESGEASSGRAAAAVARARAFIALGKGRGKDAEAIAADARLSESDRAVVLGWSALARQDFTGAAKSFAAAEASSPPAAPSKIAARFALGLAREAALLPGAADTYRAVLAEVPGHFGAGLGVLRTAAIPAAARRKAAEALLAQRARDASPAERGEAQVRVAEAAWEQGDRAAGEAAIGRARAADPAGVALAIALGDRALGEGHEDEALAAYKAALSPSAATARTPALQFARVAAFIGAGRTAEAVAALERLERALPRDARAAFWRGQIAERTKTAELSVSETAYQEALARNPKFFPASLDLARLRLGRHRTQEALAVLKRAEAQGTAPVALRMALGEALLAAGNPGEAVVAFRQALSDDAKNVAAQVGLASALYASGDAPGASTELAALAARPDAAKFGARMGELLVKLGRRPDGLAAYQREIVAGNAAPPTKVAAARLALELGKTAVAEALAQAAVDDDPRTPGALFVLAEVLRSKGDLARAVTELRRAQAVDGSPEVQLEYGRILASMGRDDEAITALNEAREIPEAGIERGRIQLRRGNLAQAVGELETATAKLATNAEAFLLLGQAQDRLGQADKAEAAFKTAAHLSPTLAEVRYRLGRLLVDRGAVAAALPHLRAATEHVPAAAPWHPDLYFQLGFAEQRQGSHERATAAFRRYLELAPADAPARAEVMKQLAE